MSVELIKKLEQDGIAILPGLIPPSTLANMQSAFRSRLAQMRWNDVDGYEVTERYRHMVNDVLTLDQGFVDAALHPDVTTTLHNYLGGKYELVEAKGWKSLPTNLNFHGWHADAWYDQTRVTDRIPREVKLAIYLTDVKSGAFVYVKGTHGQHHPQMLTREAAAALPKDRFVEMLGPAGTAFLFDTTGFHRQNMPILEPREAVFYGYHDPAFPLQEEDVSYNRYHPLVLNAAFLGNLTPEHHRVLGFGNQTNFIRGFQRKPKHTTFQAFIRRGFKLKIRSDEFTDRVNRRLKRIFDK